MKALLEGATLNSVPIDNHSLTSIFRKLTVADYIEAYLNYLWETRSSDGHLNQRHI